jgi:hypothetical protein
VRAFLKTAVLIALVLVLFYVVHRPRMGRVAGRWGTDARATDPWRFGLGIAVWVLMALVMGLIARRAFV